MDSFKILEAIYVLLYKVLLIILVYGKMRNDKVSFVLTC